MFSVSSFSFTKSFFIVTIFTISTLSTPLFAWATVNGIPVCTATNDQQNPVITSDSAGGYIVTWQDYRNGVDGDIYAQRVNSQGSTLWTLDGIAVCSIGGDQLTPAMVSDGSGGAIITWQDNRSGHNNNPGVYAQRINSTGSTLWKTNGVVISTTYTGIGSVPNIISDGAGGVIITMYYNGGSFGSYLYGQRVNAQGSTLWMNNGVPIFSGSNQGSPVIARDGSGGIIVGWTDEGSYKIYVQRVSSTGSTLWSPNGNILSTLGYFPYVNSIASDTSGGAYITWISSWDNASPNQLFCQRIDSQGSSLWATNGLDMSSTGNSPWYSMIVSD